MKCYIDYFWEKWRITTMTPKTLNTALMSKELLSEKLACVKVHLDKCSCQRIFTSTRVLWNCENWASYNRLNFLRVKEGGTKILLQKFSCAFGDTTKNFPHMQREDQNFFTCAKGGPEKIGDRPSKHTPPILVKNDSSLIWTVLHIKRSVYQWNEIILGWVKPTKGGQNPSDGQY